MIKVATERHARVEVPAQAFGGDQPLVAVLRGGYVGSLHRGTVAVADPAGALVLVVGDPEQPAFLRSAAKPFQAMPGLLTGGVDRFGLSDRQLAVLCASHSGEPRHLDAVLSVLEKIGVPESALRCGIHPPLHEQTARQRWQAGTEPSPVCNNCSGAHAGMLLACRAAGWPLDSYTDPDHPLQRMIRGILAAFAQVPAEGIEFGVDNCAVPTFRLPLRNAAQAFARLATGDGVSPELEAAAQRIRRAMTAHPEMVGGEDRFDSDLMAAAGGAIVAKGGAEGFQGVGLPDSGLGIAIKISDGNARAVPPASMRVLEELGALSAGAATALASYREPEIYDLQAELVGHVVPVFSFGEKT